MKNNLERFVRDNREAFDDKEPPNNFWQRIETGLDKQQTENQKLSQATPFQQIHTNRTEGGIQPIGRAGWSRTGWSRTGWSRSFTNWRVAASVAVLVLAGSFLYMNYQYGVTHQPEVVAAGPSYAKEVVQHTRLIDDKRAELEQMTQSNPALRDEFATDLERLERNYLMLKAELPQNPNQETLIQAMIQNLELQINLLNEQLRVIQRIKQQTNENPV